MKKKDSIRTKIKETSLEEVSKWYGRVYQRCLLEGCRYGIEGIDESPRDYCMYCGQKKKQPIVAGKGILDDLGLMENKDN